MKTIIFLLPVSCIIFSTSYALSANTLKNKYECEYEFELNKSNIDPNFIEQCLNKLKENEKISSLKILASSDFKGNLHYNKKLANKRLNNTYEYVSKKVVNLKNKELVSVGKSLELGKKVYITFHTEEKVPAKLVADTQYEDTNKEVLINTKPVWQKNAENYEYYIEAKPYKLDFKRE